MGQAVYGDLGRGGQAIDRHSNNFIHSAKRAAKRISQNVDVLIYASAYGRHQAHWIDDGREDGLQALHRELIRLQMGRETN